MFWVNDCYSGHTCGRSPSAQRYQFKQNTILCGCFEINSLHYFEKKTVYYILLVVPIMKTTSLGFCNIIYLLIECADYIDIQTTDYNMYVIIKWV